MRAVVIEEHWFVAATQHQLHVELPWAWAAVLFIGWIIDPGGHFLVSGPSFVCGLVIAWEPYSESLTAKIWGHGSDGLRLHGGAR